LRKLFVLNIFLVLIVLFACSDPETPVSAVDSGDLPSLTGPYLGQEPPGQEPELFAPGLVSTGAPGNGLQDIYWVSTEVIAEFLQP